MGEKTLANWPDRSGASSVPKSLANFLDSHFQGGEVE